MSVCFEFTTIVNLEDRTCCSRENKEIKKLNSCVSKKLSKKRRLALTQATRCSHGKHAHDHITDARVRGDGHTTRVVSACANLALRRGPKSFGTLGNVSRTESIDKHVFVSYPFQSCLW